MNEQNQIQIWVLPYQVQGHINPVLQFTKRLASKSQFLTLTFLLPLPPSKSTSTSTNNHPSIHFKPISDGSQQSQTFPNIASYMDQFNQFVPHSLDNLIRQELQVNDSQQPPLKVLIYDSVTPWALDVATRHGLIGAAFFAQNCIVSSVYFRLSVGNLSNEAERAKLPVGFVDEVLGKGLVVSWCSQLDVLSHVAIGCFVTHCGWNSVLEALSLGVPVVAVPQFSDQPTNAKFVQDVWKVGLRVETDSTGKLAQRDQIQMCIEEVLDGGKKGKVFKENADEWKRLSKETVDEGGSSDKNIDQFVANVLSR